MNTLNQSLSEYNRVIVLQACQDVCHPNDYSLVCSLRSYIWRVSERSHIYIYFFKLTYIWIVSLHPHLRFRFLLFCFLVRLLPGSSSAHGSLLPCSAGKSVKLVSACSLPAPLRRHASIIPQLASDNRLRCVWRILTGAIRCFRWECLRSSSASDRSVRTRDSDSTPALWPAASFCCIASIVHDWRSMTRPIRYLPSHDVIAMRYACMVCDHCSHCCCRACFSRKLCSCGVGSVIMEVYDGVRNLWFSVISKPYRLRSWNTAFAWMHAFMLQTIPSDCSCCGSIVRWIITRTVNIYPTCGDMWKSFRFIISWR